LLANSALYNPQPELEKNGVYGDDHEGCGATRGVDVSTVSLAL
jgi:hypothetical protein